MRKRGVEVRERGREVVEGREREKKVIEMRQREGEVMEVREREREVMEVREREREVMEVKERHQRHSPVVHFYSDGVAQAGRIHFSVIQKLHVENHQLLVCKLCEILMALCHLCALLLSIFVNVTKGYITLSKSVMHSFL